MPDRTARSVFVHIVTSVVAPCHLVVYYKRDAGVS